MFSMLTLLVVVAVVGVSVAERKCAGPSWRAHERSLSMGVPQDQYTSRYKRALNTIYYDRENERIAIVLNNQDFRIIYLFKEGLRFIISDKKNTCRVKEIPRRFPELCSPENTKYLFDVQLGYAVQGEKTISAKAYFAEFERREGRVGVMMTVTSDRYIPIQATEYGLGKHKYIKTTVFGNIAEPIPSSETDVFSIPPNCKLPFFQHEELTASLGPVARMLLGD